MLNGRNDNRKFLQKTIKSKNKNKNSASKIYAIKWLQE
jgi:hypothetical protein